MAKMCRPTDGVRENKYVLKLSDKELEMLEFCCENTGLSKADILRTGVRIQFESYTK